MNKYITALSIDDEELCNKALSIELKKYCPDIKFLGSYTDPVSYTHLYNIWLSKRRCKIQCTAWSISCKNRTYRLLEDQPMTITGCVTWWNHRADQALRTGTPSCSTQEHNGRQASHPFFWFHMSHIIKFIVSHRNIHCCWIKSIWMIRVLSLLSTIPYFRQDIQFILWLFGNPAISDYLDFGVSLRLINHQEPLKTISTDKQSRDKQAPPTAWKASLHQTSVYQLIRKWAE